MWSQWLTKLRLKLLYSFAKAVEVEPFLRINPNLYCPACGNCREGRINAVVLDRADASGSKVGVQHTCGVCNFSHIVPSVTVIMSHLLEVVEDENEREVREMKSDKRTKNVRAQVKVNNEVVSQK